MRTADGRVLLWAFRSAPVGRDGRGRRLVVGMAADMTERRETEARLLRLLMREVDHRAKNALAVVQAVVQLSRADDPKTYAEAVQGRIAAIAQAHSLLATSNWSGADLHSLVEGRLASFADGDRVEVVGSPVSVRAEAAQAVSMCCTSWRPTRPSTARCPGATRGCTSPGRRCPRPFAWTWVEKVGTPVAAPPTQKGFGTTLMHSIVENQLQGRLEMDWRAEGLRCRVWLPADTWDLNGVIEAPPGRDEPTSPSTVPSMGSAGCWWWRTRR